MAKSNIDVKKLIAQMTLDEKIGQLIQLYMHDIWASAVRPVQSLIGFEKITLEPHERKTVIFKVTEPMLRFYDFNCNFISEAGEFTLSTGYADHLIHTKSFILK